jgi:hypothetical protein
MKATTNQTKSRENVMNKQKALSGIALCLIGAAAVSISGVADAFTVQQVNTAGFTATVGDKVFRNFAITGADPGDSVTIIEIGDIHQVNLDATASGNPLQGPGTIAYQVQITDPNKFFYQASADLQGGGLQGKYSTTLNGTTLSPSPLTAQNPGGSSAIGTFSAALQTIDVSGAWIASDTANFINSFSHKFTQANVSINLVKTVGTDPNVCANTNDITVDPGTKVYYCYTVTNTGPVALKDHTLVDNKLGTIFSGLAYNLAPGASLNTVQAGLTVSTNISAETTNTAEWTGCTAAANPRVCVDASSMAIVRVNTPPPPPSNPVPTLSEWAMMAMVGFMAIMGGLGLRRREIL